MLRLKGITKNYKVVDNEIRVLKGLDICFRKNEFVSILGPSGCGKTTTLNIVGGLDKYTSGDLIISGKSTKDFKEKDWDAYRNRRIGFVFQSYNLIPHQTVLGNVELALTISGVSKEERVKRALKALERVGLKGEENKRPNQLSGGQCQRVAIARALVNEPDILLADEPTGALDSKTSVQIMDLIKEISKDKLVIMVTHNGEIAEKYSTRIVRLVDGEITEDTNPYSEQDEIAETKKQLEKDKKATSKKKKVKMSWWTAFRLSLRNLFTKRGRTILTSFAGSIGIIGIALILAVSQGMTSYINYVQESTLSTYPLAIERESVDLTSMIKSFMGIGAGGNDKNQEGAIYKEAIITDLVNALSNVETSENDLKSFKAYLDEQIATEGTKFNQSVTGVKYSYNLDMQIYTKNLDGNIIKSDTTELITEMITKFMTGKASGGSFGGSSSSNSTSSMGGTSMMSMFTSSGSGLWTEMLSGTDGQVVNALIKDQYQLIHGDWPNEYDEVVLVVNDNYELDDLTLYALGLLSEEEIDKILDAAIKGEELEKNEQSWTYEEICSGVYKTILPYDSYVKVGDKYMDLRTTEQGLSMLYNDALQLKVVGIIRENPTSDAHMLSGSIGYTYKLTEHVIKEAENSDVVKDQIANPLVDVITGKPFKATTRSLTAEEKQTLFLSYAQNLSAEGKANLYLKVKSIMPNNLLIQKLFGEMSNYPDRASKEQKVAPVLAEQAGVSEEQIKDYIANLDDQTLSTLFMGVITLELKAGYAEEQVLLANQTYPTAELKAAALDELLAVATVKDCENYYDNAMDFSESTYEDNLKLLGYIDIDSPSTINLYTSSFANKDLMISAIADYNKLMGKDKEIKYNDLVGTLMSSVTQIVDAVTYVLIAFVSISLIVSSIMIGVITLISVQERTKEIGILRAIGASRKDVSNMFNAETVIIGLASGLTGVIVTYLLCLPINVLLHVLTGVASLNAVLPIGGAIILIGISVLLTLLSGIIPSRSASKKDPVVALRTE